MIPKIHRINASHRRLADHAEDLAGYVERNDPKYANLTYEKLLAEARNMVSMLTKKNADIIRHTYGTEERDTCSLCQLDPAGYANDVHPDYPRLCGGCLKWNGPDMIADYDPSDWKPV